LRHGVSQIAARARAPRVSIYFKAAAGCRHGSRA
jgi:hypothetical protein